MLMVAPKGTVREAEHQVICPNITLSVCVYYLWRPEVKDVLEMRMENKQLALHSFIITPQFVHLLKKRGIASIGLIHALICMK